MAQVRAPAIPWESLLETNWHEQFKTASRRVASGLTGQLQNLHAGLGALLQQALPLSLDAWVLTEVQPTSVGDNPNYGVVSLLSWEHQPRSDGDGALLKLGVGFLLARGPGLPHDLRSKLDFFRRPRKGDRLLLFWPTPSDRENLVETLPAATRGVWNESRHKGNVTLRRVSNDELCTLLAVPEWLNAVRAVADQPMPPEVVQSFIKEKFQSILHLITPPLAPIEGALADEN